MNHLSSRLYRALTSPLTRSVSPSLSNYPSAASVKVTRDDGSVEVIGSCNREQWYRRKGIRQSEVAVANWRLAALHGNAIHNLMSDLLDQHGFQMGIYRIAKEHKIYDSTISLSGRSDYVAWDKNLEEPIGIEFKSVGDWKSKKALEMPIEEHVLQAMIYLDYYRTHIFRGETKINRWYIWYIARSEGWHLKGPKNMSPFTQIWDFYITLGENKSPKIYAPSKIEEWNYITIDGIRDRYTELEEADRKDEIPDRDFQLKYSEEKIAGLYKLDKLELKKHKTAVEKWLKKGGEKGALDLDIGDFQCKCCEWKSICWGIPYSPPQEGVGPLKDREETKEDKRKKELSIL